MSPPCLACLKADSQEHLPPHRFTLGWVIDLGQILALGLSPPLPPENKPDNICVLFVFQGKRKTDPSI